MQSNPILTFFKISAFAVLAFLVWISFWQALDLNELTDRASYRRASALVKADRTLCGPP